MLVCFSHCSSYSFPCSYYYYRCTKEGSSLGNAYTEFSVSVVSSIFTDDCFTKELLRRHSSEWGLHHDKLHSNYVGIKSLFFAGIQLICDGIYELINGRVTFTVLKYNFVCYFRPLIPHFLLVSKIVTDVIF